MNKKALFFSFLTACMISIQAQTTCEGPTNLTATPHFPDYRNVTLNWAPVADTQSRTVTLSNPMDLSNRIGWGGGSSANVVPVTRYTTGDLTAYHGYQFTDVLFAPGVSSSFATFEVVVFQGGSMDPLDSALTSGTLIYSQPVTTALTAGAINTIPLTTPITIDSTQELWVGVHIITMYGYPVYVTTAADASHHYQTLVGDASYTSWSPLSVSSGTEYTWCIGMNVTNSTDRPQGYMVYRNQTPLTSAPITSTIFVDSLGFNGTFQYDVTAKYANNCESTPITATIEMGDDTCVIYDLPFTENFDSYPGYTSTTGTTSNLPECWHHICGTYSSYAGYPIIYNSSTYSHSGNNSLRFYTTTSSSDYGHQVAILPPVDITSYPMNTLQIEFYGRASATSSNFNVVVGVMDNYYDLRTFVPIDTFSSSSTTHTEFITNFSQYTGNGAYIALMAPRDFASNYGYIDDIRVCEIPSCPKPRDIASLGVTQTSISLTWNEVGSASEWEVEYGPSGFRLGEGTRVPAMTNPVTVNGLSPSLTYDFYVRAVCGNGDTSMVTGPFTAATECGNITQLPYRQNFDAFPGTTSTSGSTNLPQFCWSNINTGSSYGNHPIVYSTSSYANSQPNSLRFYTYYTVSYSDQYAIMPALDPSIQVNTLMLEYKARLYSTSYPFHVIIGVMNDSSDVSTFVPVDTLLIPTTAGLEYRDFITMFNNYSGTGRYIAFKGVKPTSNYMAGNIDDIVLDYIPSCMHPSGLTVQAYASEEVTVSWEPRGDETSWEVVVVPTGSAPGSGIAQMTSNYPFTMGMLTPETQYDVYVRAYCGGTDYSTWKGPVTFRTRCAITSQIPYEEHFDSYGTATSTSATSPGPIPTCWERYTNYTAPYPYISSTQHIGTGALYFYSTSAYYSMAVSQPLDLSSYSANSLVLSFKALKTSDSYGRLQVGVMTKPDSMETFVLLKNIYSSDFPSLTTWTDFNIILPDNYPNPIYLAFISPDENTNYVYVDDVVLDEISTCSEPRYLSVSQVHGTSAMISWTPALFGNPVYMLQYSELGLENWSSPVAVTGTFYMLSGLQPTTQYEVRVYSDCSTEVSDTVTKIFRTNCLSGGDVVFDEGTTTTYFIPINNYYNYCYTQEIFLASELNGAADFNSISFDYAYASPMTKKTNVNVYLGHTTQSDFASTSSWVPFNNLQLVYSGSLNCTVRGWNTFVLDSVFHYNGNDNLVLVVDDNSGEFNGSAYVFHYQTQSPNYRSMYNQSDSSNPDPTNPPTGTRTYNRCNVKFGSECDSVWVCVAPNVYVSSINDNEVTINWAPGNTENSWAVEYKLSTDENWTSEGTVSTNSYTFSNLNTGSNYQFRVCALCSSVDSSDWITVSAFVPCSPILTLPYTQDFESATGSGSSHSVDPCLTRGTNSTTAYPYPSSTYSYGNGTYSMYFYGTSSAYSYLALPQMDESIQMDSLLVQFQALKTSAAYYVEAGIMEDPDDISSFTSLGTFSPTQTSTTSNQNWEMFDFATSSYTGTGRYIAFRIPQSITSYIYLDDIVVDYIPSCLHVTNLQAGNITANSVEISWTPGSDEQAWVYVYGLEDSVDLATATFISTTSNPLTLTGLQANTAYEIYVAADCNEAEPSQFMMFRFRTECEAIASIPYYAGFDEYGGVSGNAYYPHCWYRHNTYSTTSQYPYLSTSNSTSAPQSLYFYSSPTATPPTYNLAITNELDSSINIQTLQARFQLRATSSGYYMVIGVVTDPEDPNTFTPVDTVESTATSTWEEFTVSLATYSGQGRHIAFKGYGGFYFDDLWIEEISACDAPENLVISGITNQGVTLNWDTVGMANEWEVYIFPEDSSLAAATVHQVQNNPTLTLTGLSTGTQYNVYLRSVCPNGGHSNYINTSFTTMCDPLTTIPYTENFDNVAGTTASTVNNLPACWSYHNTGTNYPGYPIVYDNSSYSLSGSNSLRFYTYTPSTYSDQYAIMPEFDNTTYPLSSLQLLFQARQNSTSYDFVLLVGLMSDPTDVTTFDVLDTLVIKSTDYEPFAVYFDNYTGSGKYITFMAPKPVSGYNYGNVDDIEISLAPSCLPVHRISFSNITVSSADVTWVPNGNESMWTLRYREQDGLDSTWLEIPVSGVPQTTIYNLTDDVTYEVQIQSDCGNGDVSTWTYIKTFKTECIPMTTLPFFTDFDSYVGTTANTTNNLPPCWHYINRGSSYPGYPVIYNSSSYAVSGTNSLRFYTSTASGYADQYAILPAVDPAFYPINTLQLEFDAKKYSTSYATFTMVVGVMTDPYDETTFVGVDTVIVPETTAAAHTTYFNHYTGTGTYIALVGLTASQTGVTTNSGTVDNLNLSVAPSCLPVGNVTVSNISVNSAEISWTPNGFESEWWVKYQADTTGAAADSVHVTNTTCMLSNLSPNTTYSVQVKADCGGGEESPYSDPVAFTTECMPFSTLPYTENFDSYTQSSTSTTTPTGYPNIDLPLCWRFLNMSSTTSSYPQVFLTSSSTYAVSGNCLFFKSSSSTPLYAVLPSFAESTRNLQITFTYRNEGTSSSNGILSVGYMTVPSDASTYVELYSCPQTTTKTQVVQTFNSIPPTITDANIAFRYTGGSSNNYYVSIDNVIVDLIPCTVPESLEVSNVTTSSANVTWTPAGAESSWNLQYKTASDSSWSLVPNLTSPSYTLTNLQANMAYQVQVQANCGGGEVSNWTASVSFTTMDDQCDAPTDLHLVDTTNVTAILDWSQTGTVDEWTVYYKKSNEDVWSTQITTTHPYDVYGLEPGTTYMAKVTAHCTNDMFSEPSNQITFTTSTVGVENYEPDMTEIYPNPTTGKFRIENSELRIENVEVYDVYGKRIMTVKVEDNNVELDLSGNASGVYFTRIFTDKGMVTKRIVKQ